LVCGTERLTDEKIEEEEPEEFTVSPLLQYVMNSDEIPEKKPTVAGEAKSSLENEDITSLSPFGPRLCPPKGLGALYTLQFCPDSYLENFETTTSSKGSWLAGAGKAGIIALWDCSKSQTLSSSSSEDVIDPVLSWKAHSGRWIAEARFLPDNKKLAATPSRLLSAANDGSVCLWDLTSVSIQSGAPRLLHRTGKELHASGIFAMDVLVGNVNNSADTLICTGSKDKTVALTSLESLAGSGPIWRSDFHTSKVGAVKLRGGGSTLLASASDDAIVAIHDYRANTIVAKLRDAHERPHSVVWDPHQENVFMTGKKEVLFKTQSTLDP
jgi:WD40 repeat protein